MGFCIGIVFFLYSQICVQTRFYTRVVRLADKLFVHVHSFCGHFVMKEQVCRICHKHHPLITFQSQKVRRVVFDKFLTCQRVCRINFFIVVCIIVIQVSFRPGEVMACERAMEPQDLRRLIALTGAEVVAYGGEDECCGATLYLADRDLALAAGRRKLEAVHGTGAGLLLHGCGNCQLLLRRFQRLIVREESDLRIQAVMLPQLLGLAMGIPEEDLGLRSGELL